MEHLQDYQARAQKLMMGGFYHQNRKIGAQCPWAFEVEVGSRGFAVRSSNITSRTCHAPLEKMRM